MGGGGGVVGAHLAVLIHEGVDHEDDPLGCVRIVAAREQRDALREEAPADRERLVRR